ncbi:MAG TPA: hypothetical protein VE690_14340, partial [Rhodopila sp.]|nr:hypothetical protein [Rhodopila sp.]
YRVMREEFSVDLARGNAKLRHFCVGAMLSKTEVEIGTNQLLEAMTGIRYSDGFTPSEEGVFTRAPKKLLLDFTPA